MTKAEILILKVKINQYFADLDDFQTDDKCKLKNKMQNCCSNCHQFVKGSIPDYCERINLTLHFAEHYNIKYTVEVLDGIINVKAKNVYISVKIKDFDLLENAEAFARASCIYECCVLEDEK